VDILTFASSNTVHHFAALVGRERFQALARQAVVAAIGPITVPMATLGGASPIQVGLATAFASSFANMFIVGTPNNAIVYSYAKDPETGEQLVTNRDFLVHGAAILVLNFLVLWFWTFWGYWEWMGLK